MNHEAIYAAYPQVVRIDESIGAFDADGNQVNLDDAKIDAAAKVIKSEKDAKELAQAKEKQAILDRLGITADEAKLLLA
jgi:hypothetical protein